METENRFCRSSALRYYITPTLPSLFQPWSVHYLGQGDWWLGYGTLSILPRVSSHVRLTGNLLSAENDLIVFLPQVTSFPLSPPVTSFPPGKLFVICKLFVIREIQVGLAGWDFSRDFVCSPTPLLGDIPRRRRRWQQEGRGAMTAFKGWGENGGSVGEEDWGERVLCLFPKMWKPQENKMRCFFLTLLFLTKPNWQKMTSHGNESQMTSHETFRKYLEIQIT